MVPVNLLSLIRNWVNEGATLEKSSDEMSPLSSFPSISNVSNGAKLKISEGKVPVILFLYRLIFFVVEIFPSSGGIVPTRLFLSILIHFSY